MILVGDYVGFSTEVSLDPALDGKLVLANLEGPWCNIEGKPRPRKAGPRVWNIHITEGPRWAFTLANNHMMDFAEEGLSETMSRLKARDIPFVGAGDYESANSPMILEESGKKIGVIACAEHQFGMAEKGRIGIAPMGDWLFESVRQLKKKVDVVIVSCHSAVEMIPVPSPRLRDFYRALIDAGATIIHGHHAHVPQGWESYKDGFIFYGLGNFLVSPEVWKSSKNTLWSLMVEIDFSSEKPSVCVVPAHIIKEGGNTKVVLDKKSLKDYCEQLCSVLSNDILFRGVWQVLAVRTYHELYENNLGFYPIDETGLSCRNWLKRLYHIVKTVWAFMRHKNTSIYALVQYNYMQCFSHQDCISEAMGLQLNIREDFRSADAEKVVDFLVGVGD
jgi:poly-gamma-glutamate synthesis protein (capsule biosynthesis protein)